MAQNNRCGCPRCEKELKNECFSQAFCKPRKCGKTAEKFKICPNCKAEYLPQYDKCPSCSPDIKE